MILIIDFGSQFNQLIARRVRENRVYCQIMPPSISIKEIKSLNPEGIILSGGPSSIYEKNSPKVNKGIFDLKIPVLGICYGIARACIDYDTFDNLYAGLGFGFVLDLRSKVNIDHQVLAGFDREFVIVLYMAFCSYPHAVMSGRELMKCVITILIGLCNDLVHPVSTIMIHYLFM